MILLDTNVVSELMKGQPDLRVRDWLDRGTADGLFVSAITQAEIHGSVRCVPNWVVLDANSKPNITSRDPAHLHVSPCEAQQAKTDGEV